AVPQRELDVLEPMLDVGDDGAEIAAAHVGAHVVPAREAFVLDGVGGWLDTHVGHLVQAHVNEVFRRVDQYARDAGHTLARLGLAPHPHVVHFAVPVDVGDLDAGHHGRRHPTDVAGLESEPIGGVEVDLHFHLRYGPVNLHLQIHEPGNPCQ